MNPFSRLIKSYYIRKLKRAKSKLREMQEAKIALDFESLDIIPKINDCTLKLNPKDEGISVDLYACRIREPINTKELFNLLSKENENIDYVLDVGSNLGYFPLVEIASGTRKVIAIEPVPETYDILKQNANRIGNIKTLNVAVSDKKKKIKMYVPTKLNLATALEESAIAKVRTHKTIIKEIIEVQALSLYEIIKSEGLKDSNIMIRMDVEGFEETILKRIPKEIYGLSFELHSDVLGYDVSFALIEKLDKLGYKVRVIVRDSNAFIPIIKLVGMTRALRIFKMLKNKEYAVYEPSLELVKDWIVRQKETPHVFAIKSS